MTISSANLVAVFKARPKLMSLIAIGYAMAALGFMAYITTNGTSTGISEVLSIVAASLIGAGLLLSAGGMFLIRRGLENTQVETRRNLFLQGLGIIILLVGVVLVAVLSSLSGYLIGSILLLASGASTLVGAILLRKNYASIYHVRERQFNYLVLGMCLIFAGVGLIVGSNIAFYYVLSQVATIIYADLGATVTACGCVLAAYSFFSIRYHS